jgi:DNA polymerase-3 subunit beta
MKLTINRSTLLDMLALAVGIVPGRSPRPALQGVLMQCATDRFSIAASDMETYVRQETSVVQAERAGEALADAEKLHAIIRELGDDVVALEADGTSALHIRGADAHYRIHGMKPSDFPKFPEAPDATPFSVKAADLRRLVGQVAFAAARESTRYAFNAILVVAEKGELTLSATDGRRLSLSQAGSETPDGGAQSLIPAGMAKLLAEGLLAGAKDGEEAEVRLGERQASFSMNGTTIVTSLVEGQFPPYDDIIPKGVTNKMTAGTAAFLTAVRRAGLLTSETTKGVRFLFSAGKKAVMTSRDPEMGEATIEFACRYEGEDLEVGFNPVFLADALKVVEADEITLSMPAPNRPGLIEDGRGLRVVVMPVNLS